MLQVLKCLVFLRGGTGLTQVRGLRAGQCCVKLGASHRRRGVHLALVQGGGCGARLFFEIASPHWIILKYSFQFGHTELRPFLCALGLSRWAVAKAGGLRACGWECHLPALLGGRHLGSLTQNHRATIAKYHLSNHGVLVAQTHFSEAFVLIYREDLWFYSPRSCSFLNCMLLSTLPSYVLSKSVLSLSGASTG